MQCGALLAMQLNGGLLGLGEGLNTQLQAQQLLTLLAGGVLGGMGGNAASLLPALLVSEASAEH